MPKIRLPSEKFPVDADFVAQLLHLGLPEFLQKLKTRKFRNEGAQDRLESPAGGFFEGVHCKDVLELVDDDAKDLDGLATNVDVVGVERSADDVTKQRVVAINVLHNRRR